MPIQLPDDCVTEGFNFGCQMLFPDKDTKNNYFFLKAPDGLEPITHLKFTIAGAFNFKTNDTTGQWDGSTEQQSYR